MRCVPDAQGAYQLQVADPARVDPASVLDRAEKALYYTKRHDRNGTCGYESLRARGLLGREMAAGSIDLF